MLLHQQFCIQVMCLSSFFVFIVIGNIGKLFSFGRNVGGFGYGGRGSCFGIRGSLCQFASIFACFLICLRVFVLAAGRGYLGHFFSCFNFFFSFPLPIYALSTNDTQYLDH